MKILDIVKFNDRIALVVDEIPELTYEKHGIYLTGSDDSGLVFDCLYYDYDRYAKAFAGREFDLPMKDGTTTHCSGQYWSGRVSEAAKLIGVELADVTIQTIERLKECYVFSGYQANKAVYRKMVAEFFTNNPGYEIWGYWEYEANLKNRKPHREDHPDSAFQETIREFYRVNAKMDGGNENA